MVFYFGIFARREMSAFRYSRSESEGDFFAVGPHFTGPHGNDGPPHQNPLAFPFSSDETERKSRRPHRSARPGPSNFGRADGTDVETVGGGRRIRRSDLIHFYSRRSLSPISGAIETIALPLAE